VRSRELTEKAVPGTRCLMDSPSETRSPTDSIGRVQSDCTPARKSIRWTGEEGLTTAQTRESLPGRRLSAPAGRSESGSAPKPLPNQNPVPIPAMSTCATLLGWRGSPFGLRSDFDLHSAEREHARVTARLRVARRLACLAHCRIGSPAHGRRRSRQRGSRTHCRDGPLGGIPGAED
jgi:hypothetical protein